MARRKLVVANWKMHGSRVANHDLVTQLLTELPAGHVKTVVCPPSSYLDQIRSLLDGTAIELGGQDCSHMASGAYTGEVAPGMLADQGCRWVIIGHSERRQYHQESDALVAAKTSAALQAGLVPIVCVGETREQREAGEAEAVVEAQLRGAVGDLASLSNVVVAYEPVWAIGTGLTATPAEAQEMHAHLRGLLAQLDERDGAAVTLLYGGSVKPGNAAVLFAEEDIDGALVGGASLDAAAFAEIVRAA